MWVDIYACGQLEHGWPTRGHTINKNLFFFPKKSSTVNSPQLRVGRILQSLPRFMLYSWLAWSYTGLMQVITAIESMSRAVLLSRRHYSLWVLPNTWPLQSFHTHRFCLSLSLASSEFDQDTNTLIFNCRSQMLILKSIQEYKDSKLSFKTWAIKQNHRPNATLFYNLLGQFVISIIYKYRYLYWKIKIQWWTYNIWLINFD